MKFQCPYGWKSVAKVGNNFTWEDSTVNICDGVCDSCDLCGIESCEFYDTSPEATRRFLRANAHEDTLEHLLAPINGAEPRRSRASSQLSLLSTLNVKS